MKKYYFSGDISHPAIVKVLADSPEEAEEKAKKGEIDEIMDEQDDCLLFIYNGDPIGKEYGYEDAGEEDGEDEKVKSNPKCL